MRKDNVVNLNARSISPETERALVDLEDQLERLISEAMKSAPIGLVYATVSVMSYRIMTTMHDPEFDGEL